VFFREQAQAMAAAGHRVGVIAPLLTGMRTLRRLWAVRSSTNSPATTRLVEHVAAAPALVPKWHAGRVHAMTRVGHRLFADYCGRYGMPDVLHVQSAVFTGQLGGELADRHRLPLVVTEHSTLLLHRPIAPRVRAFLAQSYARADVAVAVSNSLQAALAADFPRADGFRVVPNLVVDRFFSTPLARDVEGEQVFLAVGALDHRKGFDLLLDAVARLPARVHLRIAGEGPLRLRLQLRAAALRLGERVRFLGSLDRAQVAAEMSAAQAFVSASRSETFGVVLAEALACGLPVVATASGGPQDIVTAADGVLVPVGDVTALSKAMEAMLHDSRNYDRAALRERCRARYSAQVVAAQLDGVHALAAQRRRP
jgi:glycosyltransferase involved in cell wall biosynthesis